MIECFKTDWPKVINHLRESYLNQYSIALTDYKLARIVTERIGRQVFHRSIRSAQAGREPLHDIGEVLLELEAEWSGKNTIVVPDKEKSEA